MFDGEPPVERRAVTTAAMLARARAVARACGVTRLAELTGLDRIGLPVFHAVRPMSRALSVHQGKGVCADAARLGALMEAIESHHAETFSADGRCCRFDALPGPERARDFSDYCVARARSPLERQALRWVAVPELVGGGVLHLPFDLLSLDLTRAVPCDIERSSNGLASGGNHAEACRIALLELVERDAVGRWLRAGVAARAATLVDDDSIDCGWFMAWRERLRVHGISVSVHGFASIIGLPVVLVHLDEAGGAFAAAIYGSACCDAPALALWKAFAEAVQSRATLISGAREDIADPLFNRAGPLSERPTLPIAPPPPQPRVDWRDIKAGGIGEGEAALKRLVERLARAGHDQVGCLELSSRTLPLSVVRAFVPGLGTAHRRARDEVA